MLVGRGSRFALSSAAFLVRDRATAGLSWFAGNGSTAVPGGGDDRLLLRLCGWGLRWPAAVRRLQTLTSVPLRGKLAVRMWAQCFSPASYAVAPVYKRFDNLVMVDLELQFQYIQYPTSDFLFTICSGKMSNHPLETGATKDECPSTCQHNHDSYGKEPMILSISGAENTEDVMEGKLSQNEWNYNSDSEFSPHSFSLPLLLVNPFPATIHQ
nr:ubiquitin carboxyl-terminal hydrolase 16-like [Ipomoea batatas]